MRRRIIGLLMLSRADGAVLAFTIFFLPCYLHSGHAWQSARIATPIFLMALCTFIMNSINDVERDRVNHPKRPIPNGSISLKVSATIYFLLFLAATLSIRSFVSVQLQYYYLGGFVLAINYNTVVNNLPALKTPYAATGHALPVLLARVVCGGEAVPLLLTPAVFLFSLGREILMDLRDIRGDGATLVKSVSPRFAMATAFSLQGLGILILAGCVTNGAKAAALALIGTSFAVLVIAGFRSTPISSLVRWMRVQFLLGIVFLL
jgi:geranylgeranylglycerol-phosphate geranylgeranyltransferase